MLLSKTITSKSAMKTESGSSMKTNQIFIKTHDLIINTLRKEG